MDTESKITKEDDDKDKSSSPNNDCHMRDMIMKLPAPPAVILTALFFYTSNERKRQSRC